MRYIQDFINVLFATDDNTSATIIITILVFGIGQIFVSASKTLESIDRRLKTKKVFKEVLKEAIKSIRKQSIQYDKTALSIDIGNAREFGIKKVEFYCKLP